MCALHNDNNAERSRRDQRPLCEPTHTHNTRQTRREIESTSPFAARTNRCPNLLRINWEAGKRMWWCATTHSACQMSRTHQQTTSSDPLINGEGWAPARHGELTANWVRRPPLCAQRICALLWYITGFCFCAQTDGFFKAAAAHGTSLLYKLDPRALDPRSE